MPQGPYAIPPRHGQSQLIFPVTGSNAPLAEDSSPSPSTSPSSSSKGGGGPSAAAFSSRSEGGAESISEDLCATDVCVVVVVVVVAVISFGLAEDASVNTRLGKEANDMRTIRVEGDSSAL